MKLSDLARKQEKPLRGLNNVVKAMCDAKPTEFILGLLSFGSKHPVKDKFDEIGF